VPVVDLSAAFRLSADGFTTWYGESHPRPDLAAGEAQPGEGVVYGLPEFRRGSIRQATLVANPGCYPTAALLGLTPVAELLTPGSVVVDAMSGTSGAGRAAKDHLHFAHVHGDATAYGAPAHRHTGEIERWLPGDLGAVTFTPHLVPMSRGLLATAYGTLRDDGPDVDEREVGAAAVLQAGHHPGGADLRHRRHAAGPWRERRPVLGAPRQLRRSRGRGRALRRGPDHG
jgi:N-acetyl-gamma-glutamyl-phosphate reductase